MQPPLFVALLLIGLAPGVAWPAQARVAVAANFAEPMKAIAAKLEISTGHTLQVSTGASGAFAAQIKNGAPFDVFLSADQERPEWLETEGFVQPGSRFTYATGQLVLWSNKAGRVDVQGEVLRASDLGRVALANPKTAPYGAAAMEVIEKMGLSARLAHKRVQGESIGQTFNFAHTGNADVGFVAMSQVLEGGKLKGGSMWVIPQALYSPIRQDAALLKRGANNPAAVALMQMLQTPATQELIRSYGYSR